MNIGSAQKVLRNGAYFSYEIRIRNMKVIT